jgi:hypothetical protein
MRETRSVSRGEIATKSRRFTPLLGSINCGNRLVRQANAINNLECSCIRMSVEWEALGPATIAIGRYGSGCMAISSRPDGLLGWELATMHGAVLGKRCQRPCHRLHTRYVSFVRFGREPAEVCKRLEGQATLESHEPELKRKCAPSVDKAMLRSSSILVATVT